VGKFLLSLGFPKVAQIVGANMDLIPGPKLDKTQIVYKVCHISKTRAPSLASAISHLFEIDGSPLL